MRIAVWRVVASSFALLLSAACGEAQGGSDPVGGSCMHDGAAGAPPNEGDGPCACDDDCFTSDCSIGRCVDGACAHEMIEDGTRCLDPDWGYGACESSVCVVDP